MQVAAFEERRSEAEAWLSEQGWELMEPSGTPGPA
jgi:hypothetical protein